MATTRDENGESGRRGEEGGVAGQFKPAALEPEVRKKEFETHFKALLDMKMWLLGHNVTHVAMESTGVYWKPIWQPLEGNFQLILANPFQVKNIPGRKTDACDSQWLAKLLGMV